MIIRIHHMILICLIVLSHCLISADESNNAPTNSKLPDGFRTWVSADGNFKMVGKYISRDSSEVVLEKEDGTQINVPISALSITDRKFLSKAGEKPSTAVKRPLVRGTTPNLTLKKSPALDRIIRSTEVGTAEQRSEASQLLKDLETAASDGLTAVYPGRQKSVMEVLPIVMGKNDADFIIHLGLVNKRFPSPDDIKTMPGLTKRENDVHKQTLTELSKLCVYGTESEKKEWQIIAIGINIAKQDGLNAVKPELQKEVSSWLEPIFGKKEADKIKKEAVKLKKFWELGTGELGFKVQTGELTREQYQTIMKYRE